MKKLIENTLVVLTLIVCLSIFAGVFLYAKHILPQKEFIVNPSGTELKLTIDNYIQNHQYSETLDYLENFKKTQDNKFSGLINYYLSKTKYQRLTYLSDESKWEQYHKYKKIYLRDILKETNITLAALPKTEYALSAQFLRYWVYDLLYTDAKKDKTFEAFKDMLNDYCQSNKEYAAIKEYALMLYKNELTLLFIFTQ